MISLGFGALSTALHLNLSMVQNDGAKVIQRVYGFTPLGNWE